METRIALSLPLVDTSDQAIVIREMSVKWHPSGGNLWSLEAPTRIRRNIIIIIIVAYQLFDI